MPISRSSKGSSSALELSSLGFTTINESFYSKVQEWKSWHEGDVKGFHRYKIRNGSGIVRCKRYSEVTFSGLSIPYSTCTVVLYNENHRFDPFNETTRKYETVIVPAKTSHNEEGGYFNTEITATNDKGVSTTTDGTNIPGLRLTVQEEVPPTIQLLSPAEGILTTIKNNGRKYGQRTWRIYQ